MTQESENPVELATSMGGRDACMTETHALAHLEAKGYHEVVSAKSWAADPSGNIVWMRLFIRPIQPGEGRGSGPRKAFLWVFDPAQVYILVHVTRDGEGL